MQLKHIHLQKNRRLWVVLTLWATVSVRYPKLPPRHHRSAPCCDGTHPHPPDRLQRSIFIPAFLGTGGGQVSGSSEAWVSQQLRGAADKDLSCGFLLSPVFHCGSNCVLFIHSFILYFSSLRTSISFFYFLWQAVSVPPQITDSWLLLTRFCGNFAYIFRYLCS